MTDDHFLPAPRPAAPAPAVQLAPARYVTIPVAAAVTGFSISAIRTKIAKGVWLEGRQYLHREGRVLIDLKGYELWAAQGQA